MGVRFALFAILAPIARPFLARRASYGSRERYIPPDFFLPCCYKQNLADFRRAAFGLKLTKAPQAPVEDPRARSMSAWLIRQSVRNKQCRPASPNREETGRLTERFGRSGSGMRPAGRPLPCTSPRLLAAGRLCLGMMRRVMSRRGMFRGPRLLSCRLGGGGRRRRGRGKDRSGDHHRRCEAETDKGTNACHNLHSIRSARRAGGIMSGVRGWEQRMAPSWTCPSYALRSDRSMTAT